MGMGYELMCPDCGASYELPLGSGFLFPAEYEDLKRDIEAGCFGEEWQRLAMQTEHYAIDAEQHLFQCDSCGSWECAPSLSIYAPKAIEKVAGGKDSTVREVRSAVDKQGQETLTATEASGEQTPTACDIEKVTIAHAPTAFFAEELKSDFTLVKERIHTCKQCGHDMHMFSENDMFRAVLACPDCWGELEWNPFVFKWD